MNILLLIPAKVRRPPDVARRPISRSEPRSGRRRTFAGRSKSPSHAMNITREDRNPRRVSAENDLGAAIRRSARGLARRFGADLYRLKCQIRDIQARTSDFVCDDHRYAIHRSSMPWVGARDGANSDAVPKAFDENDRPPSARSAHPSSTLFESSEYCQATLPYNCIAAGFQRPARGGPMRRRLPATACRTTRESSE